MEKETADKAPCGEKPYSVPDGPVRIENTRIPAECVIAPGIYRHFKGNYYRVLGMAMHSETLEPMVVYQALYGEHGVWVRPASMWNETVERGGKVFRRFAKTEE